MQAGMFYAIASYILWGLFPIYFKALEAEIPPVDIVMHRMLWSFLFLVIVLTVRKQWAWVGPVLRQPRVIGGFIASALLLTANWTTYIWAVNNNHIVEASLGYFINPMVSVALGFIFLRERPRLLQWLAIALAAAAVLWLTWQAGHPPWIALTLAVTFGSYGLLRKTASLGALPGLALETALVLPLALAYLAYTTLQDHNTFVSASTSTRWLLVAAGPITSIPLLMFAAGARRIPLSLVGVLQYITPSLQLLLGVWLYGEELDGARLAGFVVIWVALALYSVEGLWRTFAARPGAST
ncbi:eamA-like transporter family protein [Collimonas fungivorans]|uniref:EamA-like transporter family protein n=1 Tax=Collimonas fungivorans TaxID=158899 RepID=A0A127PIY4_9BURK|nr:EamA family transporter RarD [Collimonas fungivorans]AMO97717.1 eamA-like transporter family protein [Collimonas fungivorans]